ncbi:MAG: dipeptidase [candidate division Zixibacteria bacterium]
MKKSLLTLILILGAFFGCSDNQIDYLKLHNDAIVVDLHSDTALKMMRSYDISQRDTAGHMDLPRLADGGVDLQVFACFLSTDTPIEECRQRADKIIDSMQAQFSRNNDRIEVCNAANEAERIIGEGKIAAFIGIENGVAIANSLENLEHFYNRGVRYLTLTHTASNDWCISSADTAPAFNGLTDFGREVVRKMNDLGMIIDISHAHPLTVEEILKTTKDPVIASHSCVYDLCPHDRNLTDEQIKAIAENDGMIGINFYTGYLSGEISRISDSAWDALGPIYDSLRQEYEGNDSLWREARRNMYRQVRAATASVEVNAATVVDHIDHIVNLVGADHVGLGSDFDGIPTLPDGLTDCSMVPNVTAELVKRGYSEQDIKKILGGNFMRVFRQVCD